MTREIAEQLIVARFQIDLQYLCSVHFKFLDLIHSDDTVPLFSDSVIRTDRDVTRLEIGLHHNEFMRYGSEIGNGKSNFTRLRLSRTDLDAPLMDIARDFVGNGVRRSRS